MTHDIRPLAVYPFPVSDYDRACIRTAKLSLDLPFLVTIVEAVPGSPTRVLALRERPPFLVDHALVKDPNSAPMMMPAMRWALDPENFDLRATYLIEQLNVVFPGIHEISDDGRRELSEMVDTTPRFVDEGRPKRHDPNDYA